LVGARSGAGMSRGDKGGVLQIGGGGGKLAGS